MFTWNDGVEEGTRTAISAGLDRLELLDVVADYQHGPDLHLAEGNWDYVVVGDFQTVEDYQSYAANAEHKALISDLIAPNISGRTAVQYEYNVEG